LLRGDIRRADDQDKQRYRGTSEQASLRRHRIA
jgi:hypothetical protein